MTHLLKDTPTQGEMSTTQAINQVNISMLEDGLYFLKVIDGIGKIMQTNKIVIIND